ncbi:hypothetical protein C8Q70DRAFT_933744 [Cubamyces menziesii]|nr:hypothetical protein C8Q70DRAFT_933744 [Cubamyces menziesii]
MPGSRRTSTPATAISCAPLPSSSLTSPSPLPSLVTPLAAPPSAQPLDHDTSSKVSTSRVPTAQIANYFTSRRLGAHSTFTTSQPHLPTPIISGLTPSQRIVSVATGVDPRCLLISNGESDAFFLFMRLRKEYQWASFKMTPFDWVCAASHYNREVDRLKREHGKSLIYKTPRALMEKLGEIEPKILARIASANYRCTYGPVYSLLNAH